MPCKYSEHVIACGIGGFTVGRLPRHLRRKNRRQAMGGGTSIMHEIIPELVKELPDVEQRARIYRTILSALEGCDYDQHGDTYGIDPVWDAVVDARFAPKPPSDGDLSILPVPAHAREKP